MADIDELQDRPWDRTAEDYLKILAERPDASFGEYDNTDVLFQMIHDGLIEWRPDKVSMHTSMRTSLYPRLTEKGRAMLTALAQQEA